LVPFEATPPLMAARDIHTLSGKHVWEGHAPTSPETVGTQGGRLNGYS